MKHGKLILLFNLVLFLIFLLKVYQEYRDIEDLKSMAALSESSSIAHLTKSFRQTYQNVIIDNKIPINERTIELLPVKTISEVSRKFSEYVDSEVIVRTVSDRPRNQTNLANPEETRIINFFRNNPDESSILKLSENGGYIYAEPLFIKPVCLKCHGKKEDAPELIQKLYDKSYDYKLGDIRGLLSISYYKNDFIKKLDHLFYQNLIAISIVFTSLFIGIFILVKLVNQKDDEHNSYIKEQNRILRKLSITDTLTGLKTRTYYNEIISREMARVKRDGKYLVYAIFDLDNFKLYNDNYGHIVGDSLLQQIGSIFLQTFHRPSDYVFRIGGEEFVALYTVDDISNATDLVNKITKKIYELNIPHIGNEPFKRVTISGGVDIYKPDEDNANDKTLYRHADNALYRAKDAGRNQTYIYSDL